MHTAEEGLDNRINGVASRRKCFDGVENTGERHGRPQQGTHRECKKKGPSAMELDTPHTEENDGWTDLESAADEILESGLGLVR